MSEYILEMTDIDKTFPGVKALNHAQLKVRPGTVHALMGENGAGKSTLMKCLFGVYIEDSGEIRIDGSRSALPTQSRRSTTASPWFIRSSIRSCSDPSWKISG